MARVTARAPAKRENHVFVPLNGKIEKYVASDKPSIFLDIHTSSYY